MSGLPFLKPEDRPDCMTAPHLFYSDDKDDQAQARSLCRDCPFRIPCEEWALSHEAYGQWGYTTPDTRKVMRDAWGITLDLPHARMATQSVMCVKGLHAMSHNNVIVKGDGSRLCRFCKNDRQRVYDAARRAT